MTTLPPDVRAAVVRHFAMALAAAWQRQDTNARAAGGTATPGQKGVVAPDHEYNQTKDRRADRGAAGLDVGAGFGARPADLAGI